MLPWIDGSVNRLKRLGLVELEQDWETTVETKVRSRNDFTAALADDQRLDIGGFFDYVFLGHGFPRPDPAYKWGAASWR